MNDYSSLFPGLVELERGMFGAKFAYRGYDITIDDGGTYTAFVGHDIVGVGIADAIKYINELEATIPYMPPGYDQTWAWDPTKGAWSPPDPPKRGRRVELLEDSENG